MNTFHGKVEGDTIRFKAFPPEYKRDGVIRNLSKDNSRMWIYATERKQVQGSNRRVIVEIGSGHTLSNCGKFQLHKNVPHNSALWREMMLRHNGL